MNEIFTRNRLVTCRTRCVLFVLFLSFLRNVVPRKSLPSTRISLDPYRSTCFLLFFLSILLPSRGDRISYRRVGRVERKNGKHRMVGNVARWNVTHPGEERGEGLGRKDQHSRCNPVSHRLVIPSHTCSPSHHLLRPFSGSCSPAFHRPLRLSRFPSSFVTELESPSSFIYLFIFLLRTRIRKRKRERKFNFRMKEEALVLKIVPYRRG